MDALTPKAEAAIAFLCWLNKGTVMHLEHMRSEGPAMPTPRLYAAQDRSSAVGFVATNNSAEFSRNMYFLPNAEFLSGGREKSNITAVRFLHVDLDRKDYSGTDAETDDRILGLLLDANRRPKGVPAPTAFWFTGGGYQAVWRLVDPTPRADAEIFNKALLSAFQGGAGTHDSSRLLRLPGTVNWLNDKKRRAGRLPALSIVFDPTTFAAPPVEYALSDFTLRLDRDAGEGSPPALPKPGGAAFASLEDFAPLPLPSDLSGLLTSDSGWVEAIASGEDPPDKHYRSRSELVLAATVWMLGHGIAAGHVLSIITSSALGISAHALDQPSPMKYARRQIARAMAFLDARRGDWPVLNKSGLPVSELPVNVRYALAKLSVDAQRNLFTQTDEVSGFGLDGRDLNEIAEILSSAFSRLLLFNAGPPSIKRELIAIAHERTYHPVIDYLDSLLWDGVPRLDQWLTQYCGAEVSELNSEFGSKFLIAGVRRIKTPGVKFDTMLVLEGSQGAGKSQLAARLAVRPEWFCGSLDLKSDDKTKAELLVRAWIVECQELDGINKTTSQGLKKFLSTAIDIFRRAYGRDAMQFRRHCIILGTTNDATYLHDLTGNRRIWPVQVGKIDLKQVERDMDQLWAEAVVRERSGETITLSPRLWNAASEAQRTRMVEDAFRGVLEGAFADRVGRVSMDSVKLLLNIDTSRMTSHDSRRIRAVMAELGWEHGTYRLYDLAGIDINQRKGFARGTVDQRRTEFTANRRSNGTVSIGTVWDTSDDDLPF